MVHRTDQQSAFRSQIAHGASQTPRFLFRFWHSKSGGDERLNTISAITPKAFMIDPNMPDEMWRIAAQDVNEIATGHLRTSHEVVTIFSSWSQSFPFLYSWMLDDIPRGTNLHICLLDTSKLGANNAVLHTSALHRALSGVSVRVGYREDSYGWEYLAFGVIKAPAFRAIALESLLKARDTNSSIAGERLMARTQARHLFGNDDLDNRIQAVQRMASVYGPDLEVVMAAHLTVVAARTEQEYGAFINKISSSFVIRRDFDFDNCIMAGTINYHGLWEPQRGSEILQCLIIAVHGNEQAKGYLSELLSKGLSSTSRVTFEAARRAAAKVMIAIRESKQLPPAVKYHYPRMVKELVIDMNGYDDAKGVLAGFEYAFMNR